MFFSDIIGQTGIKEKLRASLTSQHIPHAQMFFGPPGTGNLPLAIAYAQYIACTGEKGHDSCGQCPGCRKFAKLAHPDLHFAFPVNTTGKITKDPTSNDFIEEWREFILRTPYFSLNDWYNHIGIENKQGLINKKEADHVLQKMNLKPFESEYKFMVIWLPEKMNGSAANHLLKLIEEPPENTFFLLVSDDPSQVLPTIASRTQPVRLMGIDEKSMTETLTSKFDIPASEIRNIVRLSNGNFIKAKEVMQTTGENNFNFEKFTGFMRYCWKREYFRINDWIEEMAGLGRERLKLFFDYSLRLIRENFISNTNLPELVYMTEKEQHFAKNFHPYINGRNITRLYTEINKAYTDIERNGYPKIILFDFSLQVVKLIRN